MWVQTVCKASQGPAFLVIKIFHRGPYSGVCVCGVCVCLCVCRGGGGGGGVIRPDVKRAKILL